MSSSPSVPAVLTWPELQKLAAESSASGDWRALILPNGDSQLAEALLVVAHVVQEASTDRESATERLLEALAPTAATPPPARLLQVRRNREARTALEREFGLLTSAEVSELAGSRSANSSALPTRWRREHRIFGIEERGGLRYPGFQFTEQGTPYPVIAQVLAILGKRISAWELALWFTGDNGWLDGARPADVQGTDPDAVVTAAHRLGEQLAA